MAWPTSLQVALKEWASVCNALESGRQILLLRKGGISDNGGVFELEHRHFLLFPTYVHQNLNSLKAAEQEGFVGETSEPSRVRLSSAGVVSDIVQIPSRPAMDALDAHHIWAKPLIDMRFSYKPAKPLYLLIVRAYRLRQPIEIENTLTYAGCISWVPLDQAIATGDAAAVLDETKFQHERRAILDTLGKFNPVQIHG